MAAKVKAVIVAFTFVFAAAALVSFVLLVVVRTSTDDWDCRSGYSGGEHDKEGQYRCKEENGEVRVGPSHERLMLFDMAGASFGIAAAFSAGFGFCWYKRSNSKKVAKTADSGADPIDFDQQAVAAYEACEPRAAQQQKEVTGSGGQRISVEMFPFTQQ